MSQEESFSRIDVSFDLETWGKTPEAEIRSIGAYMWDAEHPQVSAQFYTPITTGCTHSRRRMRDPDTVEWWEKQPELNEQLLLECLKHGKTLRQALRDLTSTIQDFAYNMHNAERIVVWGNGATFDISILEHAMRDTLVDIPWKFWDIRDVRTRAEAERIYSDSRGMPPVERVKPEIAHHALHDAEAQGLWIQAMGRRIAGLDDLPRDEVPAHLRGKVDGGST